MLGRIADLTWTRPKTVLAVLGALVIAGGAYAHDVEHHLLAAGFTDSSSESERATTVLQDALGYDANPGIVVVVRDPDGGALDLNDPAVAKEVNRVAGALAATDYVGHVDNPLDPKAGRAGKRLIAEDGESIVILGHLATQDVESDGGDAAEDAEQRIGDSTLAVSMGGFAPSFNDVNDQTRQDLTNAELIAFPILAVLLLFVFRGVVAAAIPLLVGVLSIIGTFVVLRLMSTVVDTSLFALNISTGLSLGLAVDYALLMVSRYREELERDGPTREAHRRTVLTAGRAALFSGATVAVALLSLVVLPQRFLYSLGVAGATVGIMSAVMALLVVPSILSIAGDRINALSVRRGHPVSDESDGWYRLARNVMRHPVMVAIGSAGLLLAAASPLIFTVLTGPSAQAVPPGLPSYDANAYVTEHYPRGISEAVTVTVEGPVGAPDLKRLGGEILAIDGVTDGAPFARASETVAYANFGLSGPALEGPQQDVVHEIRDLDPGDGGQILISGNTARFIDQKESLVAHAPLAIGLVAVSMMFLIFLLTGSVILPIKTLVMNALTLAATLGIVVLAFQEGLLDGLFDYTGPDAVEVTSLVFLFAVTFGLATDYAVLVMARIKEAHDSGMSNEDSVAHGIARTGRVITAAAVMIAVVFLAFAVSPVFFMKQIAVGMAFGVLIDATIVRALLVPALMRLFGEWNWWAPAPLRRFHDRFGITDP